ncbi:MAG: hypothetical protein U0892_06665 [Pirellulales bacterium]
MSATLGGTGLGGVGEAPSVGKTDESFRALEGTVRFRPDIQWVFHEDKSRWVARDPITSAFYYFSDLEHAAVCMLTGTSNLGAVFSELERRFPGRSLTRGWFLHFVGRLRAAELLIVNSPQHSAALSLRRRALKRRTWLNLLLSPLAIRIPLMNPTASLKSLTWLAALLFHPFTMSCVTVSAIVMIIAVIMRLISQAHVRLLDTELIQGDRLLLVVLCYAAVKSLHELGHALACRHWRAECNELGILLLFFTPCLYCDTTDSWKLPSRMQRAAIAFAGIYVELIIASVAAMVWLGTHDGLWHLLAANVMLICSIDTIFVNANPFLRYDGYYIFSDLWGVPNLSDQGRDSMWSLLRAFLTGTRPEAEHLDRNVWALALYAMISFVYRTFVLFAIMWLAWYFLVPKGFGFLTLLIYSVTAFGLLMATRRLMNRFVLEAFYNSAVRVTRLCLLFSIVALAAAAFFMFPIPHHVFARGCADYADKTPLFVKQTAELTSVKSAYSSVAAGEIIAELDAPEKRLELTAVRGELRLLLEREEQLRRMAVDDSKAAFEQPAIAQLISELKAKESLLAADLDALTLRAPGSGLFLPGSLKLADALATVHDVHRTQRPTDSSSLGCKLDRGTMLGWYSPMERPVIRAYVSSEDVKSIRTDMRAECLWDAYPSRAVKGRVTRIAPDPIDVTPEELIGDDAFISVRGEEGKLLPDVPHYEIEIEPEKAEGAEVLKGSVGTVRLGVQSRTLWQWLQLILAKSIQAAPK